MIKILIGKIMNHGNFIKIRNLCLALIFAFFYEVSFGNNLLNDNIPPVIHLNTFDTVYHQIFTPYYSTPISVSDNVTSSDKIIVTSNDNINVNQFGIYYENFTAEDEAGNISSVTRWIKINDFIPPMIFGFPVCINLHEPFDSLDGITVTDNYYSQSELIPGIKIIFNNVKCVDLADIISS